jgi:hypothetical protein
MRDEAVCVCLLLQDLLQSGCSRGGEEESGGHVRDELSRWPFNLFF